MKAAHVALSGATKQEIRLRFGRDDKGEGEASMESGCRSEGIFQHLGWGHRPMTPPTIQILDEASKPEKVHFGEIH
jgi:hypothetical protein